MCDILEGLRYMHGYPIPIPQGDLTPENISVDIHGRAKVSLISFGRMLAGLPRSAAVTATIESILPFRWMSPELLIDGIQQPATESDMWAFGCVCFWILTRKEPYASIKRDDIAGTKIMQGYPPATLADIFYRSTWITNGLWSTIARCWRHDPLQRPSATAFLKLLTQLEERGIPWLPVDVVDLAGKLKSNSSRDHQQRYNPTVKRQFVWKRFSRTNAGIIEEVHFKLAMYEATYAPKWYSKATPVIIKAGFESESSARAREALYSATQNEVGLVAQINHPYIQKLLGIDSSATHTHMPGMIFESVSQVTLDHSLSQGLTNFHEIIRILRAVGSAVTYLHGHTNGAIAHGDIQPVRLT
ncbi:kinase-like domain-containing protein [Rhizoctonia solani]|nr:kinase-like domain-containing protein [Rhizoctonia solani]